MVALLRDQGNNPYTLPQGPVFSYRYMIVHKLLARQQETLHNIAIIIGNDARIYRMQCQAAIKELTLMRIRAKRATYLLEKSQPVIANTLRPYGLMFNLIILEVQLDETLRNLRSFANWCETDDPMRITSHLALLFILPAVETTFDDYLSQSAALLERDL